MNGTARVVWVRGATGGVDPVIKVQLSFVDVPVRIHRNLGMVVSGGIGTFEFRNWQTWPEQSVIDTCTFIGQHC